MKTIKQSLLSIVIGLALAAGVSYAASWVGPTANPPAGNTDTPVNVGASTQYKIGALGIGGLFRAYGQTILATTTINGDINIPTGAGNGKVLTSDASGKGSWQSGTGLQSDHGKQRFTSSGTFTVPTGSNTVWVSMSGGGGGGGYGGGGGGAAAVIAQQVSVSGGTNISITIGSGGIGLGGIGYSDGHGGTSSFGSYITTPGGGGGSGDSGGVYGGPGGSSGLYGAAYGGLGGGSIFGSGGSPSSYINGGGYGGGGGGSAGSGYGGNGTPGFVLVEW